MAQPQPPARRENVLTRKLGPLPTWAWVVIAAALVIGLAWLKTSRASKKSGGQTAAGSGQVPQFVNQTYTTIQPPVSEPPEDDDDKHRRRHPRHKPEPVPDRDGRQGGGGTGPPTRDPALGPRGL